jgi:hypothetical protein
MFHYRPSLSAKTASRSSGSSESILMYYTPYVEIFLTNAFIFGDEEIIGATILRWGIKS